MTLTAQLFWISFFLKTPVFVLQWISLHWEILMLLSQFPLTFCQIQKWMPYFIAWLITILALIGMVLVIIWEMFRKRISSNSVLLLLLVSFASGFRLELIYIFFILNFRSNLTHLTSLITHINHFFRWYH